MKPILPLALAFLLVSMTICFAEDLPHPGDTVTFKYLEATAAYECVRNAYPEISSVVTDIQVTNNTITLDLTDPRAEEVRKRLAAIDHRPKMIKVQLVVAETDKAHSNTADLSTDRILTRPTYFLMEGQPGVFSQRLDNGKYLKITVTSISVPGVAEK